MCSVRPFTCFVFVIVIFLLRLDNLVFMDVSDLQTHCVPQAVLCLYPDLTVEPQMLVAKFVANELAVLVS